MIDFVHNLAIVASHVPHAPIDLTRMSAMLLYFAQAGTYAFAYRAIRRGGHAPGHVYLASSLIYLTLGVLFWLAIG